jgi:serine/threonine protein kinase
MYGLGATLYALLTGLTPIDALSRVLGSMSEGVDPLKPANLLQPTVPPAVAETLGRAMSISSADRFETVEEFWQAFTADSTQQIPRTTAIDLYRSSPPQQDIEDSDTQSLRKVQLAPHAKKRDALRIFACILVILALGLAFFSYLNGFTVLLLCCLGVLLLSLGVLLRDLTSRARRRKSQDRYKGIG